MRRRLVVITDLDGTLLDERSYSFEDARPALKLLDEKGIPLILCSSKTRAEIELYRERLSNTAPFVSENGGAVFIPLGSFPSAIEGERTDGYTMIVLGARYEELRKAFVSLRERMNVSARGFGDMTEEEVSRLSGIPVEEAELSRKREFDEPFVFIKEDEQRAAAFLKAIEERGFQWTRGRFYHILGGSSKGRAVSILRDIYRKSYGDIRIIALGDSLNDLPMLEEADFPVLIPGERGFDPSVELDNLIRAQRPGPAGWNSAVTELVMRLQESGETPA